MDTPPIGYFKYDSLSAAFHEIGHGVVQAVTDIGPEALFLREDNGAWFGHSRAFSDAKPTGAQSDLMAMAGPVAQVLFAEESLAQYAGMLRDGILKRCEELLAPDPVGRILLELHWGGDMQCNSQILSRVKAAAGSVRHLHPDGYLCGEEEALRTFFRIPEVEKFVREQAALLSVERHLDAVAFVRATKAAVPQAAVDKLLLSAPPERLFVVGQPKADA